MQSKLVHESEGQRTFVAILDTDEEILASLKSLAREHRLTAAQITAIGALSRATIGYFDWGTKDYRRIPVDQQVEVVSLNGDIALDAEGGPALHCHIVLGCGDGSTRGGHLLEGHVRPTLELVITESPAHLRRKKDSETGLTLIDLGAA
jgi:predicted DNA-binding protein with PD1-like motif